MRSADSQHSLLWHRIEDFSERRVGLLFYHEQTKARTAPSQNDVASYLRGLLDLILYLGRDWLGSVLLSYKIRAGT